jgi:hypothetical protein
MVILIMTDKWVLYKKYIGIYKMKDNPKVEYIITNEMVSKIKKDIIDKKEVETIKDNKYRFYKMYKENKVVIAYTNLKINKMIYNMIKYSLGGKKTYINMFDNYIGVKIRLLDVYKGNINKRIIKEIKNDYEIKEKSHEIIKPNKEIKKENIDNKIDFKGYRNIINKYYQNIEPKKYYIFSIKGTIYGGFQKGINKQQLEKEIGFKFEKKDVNIIGDIDVKSKLEGLIYIDKYIHDHKIDQPYYIYKNNVTNSEKYIFSLIQLDKIKERIHDIDYSKIDEYLYGIRIKDYYFFDKSSGRNTMKHNLENIYMTNIEDDKYGKIRKLILTVPENDIKLDILKIKYFNSDINLDVLLERYKEKYTKNINKPKQNIYKYLYAKNKK